MPFDQEEDNKYYREWMSLDREKPSMSPQVDTAPNTQDSGNKYYDEWMSLPTPPPMEPTGREKAKEMVELATKAGRIPSTNIVKDLVKKYTEPGYVSRMGTGEYWKKAGENLLGAAKEFVPGMVKLAVETLEPIIQPGHAVMEQGMEQAAVKKAKEMGVEPSAEIGGKTWSPVKNFADLALWGPKTLAKVIQDPVGMIEKQPLDVLFLASIGLKRPLTKALDVNPLSSKEFGGILKEVATEHPEFQIPDATRTALVHVGTRLAERPVDFYITPEGKAIPGAVKPIELTKPGAIKTEPAVPQGKIPEKVSAPQGKITPIPDTAGVIPKEQMPSTPALKTASGFMKTEAGARGLISDLERQLQEYEKKEALKVRKTGPGEVKGLGIEFVNDKGQPISRAEAFRGKQTRIEPSIEEPGKIKVVMAPKSPYEDSLSIVQNVIKESPKLIRSQAILRHAELQKRVAQLKGVEHKLAGEAGLYEKYGILSKPLPAETAKPIRQLIPQEHADNLYNMIETSPELSPFNKVHTGDGLRRIFEGELAQPSQLRMLETVFGPEFVKTIETAKPTITKLKEFGIELASLPRAWMASGDFSFGWRQGVVMAFAHPGIFWKSFGKQFKYFAKEKFLDASNVELASRDTFKLAVDHDLSLTGMEKYVDRVAGKGRHEYLTREEPFQSRLAERIPIMGPVVKASNRAYSGFANRLRMDTFDYLVKRAIDKGRNPFNDPKLARSIAAVVNSGTGRGSLGKFERYAPLLNATLFSPKLAISRFEVLLNPIRFRSLDKFARVEALRQLASTVGGGLTILGLAKMAGAKVGTDWRSADFGKIQIGNTRFDIWGGFIQYARLAGQLFTGEIVSSTTGKLSKLGEGYRPRTRADILRTTAEYKLSPPFSFALSLLKGQEAFGGEFKLTDEVTKRLIPIIIQDLVDVYKDDPSLLPISALGIFGVGLQTYSPSSYRRRHGTRTSLR